jgi:4-hydroxybenzoate polyprenyltransferase
MIMLRSRVLNWRQFSVGALGLLRVHHWIKNSFVFAPLLFAGKFREPDSVLNASFASFIFCLAASAVYIVNDLHDVEADRIHPEKRISRALASGRISASGAMMILFLLYCALCLLCFALPSVSLAVIFYILLNFAYTYQLKKIPVVDIFTVASGFVLRVWVGSSAIGVSISGWMFVTTFCLALYLASIKRRQELKNIGAGSRDVLGGYSLKLIDRYCELSATGALVFYSSYVLSVRPQLVVTLPLVLFGLFRYWYLVEGWDLGESPTEVLLKDWQLILCLSVWLGLLFMLIPVGA